MKNRERVIIAVAITLLLLSDPAFAQIAGIGGGGGQGLLSAVINWAVTNFVQGLIAAAVLVSGGLLLFGRHQLAALAVAAIGALVIANYQTISALFAVGGG